jgi:HK97 family phage portal protein
MNMVDAQYIEARKFTRSEICSIFGVPPHKIGDLERATFSNIEHQALEFVQDAVVPRCVRWEQAIHRDLLDGDPNLYAKHNVSGLLRGDAKSRNEALQIQRRNGVISANEWRAYEDLNPRPDEGGDEYIIEANMTPDDGTDPNGGQT